MEFFIFGLVVAFVVYVTMKHYYTRDIDELHNVVNKLRSENIEFKKRAIYMTDKHKKEYGFDQMDLSIITYDTKAENFVCK